VKHSIGIKKKFVISKDILLASSSANKMRASDAENILKSEKVVRKPIARASQLSAPPQPIAPIAFTAATSTAAAGSVPTQALFFCGIIDGFYGEPWKRDARFDMVSRLSLWTQFRRDAAQVRPSYMYGPKDDRKHRDV